MSDANKLTLKILYKEATEMKMKNTIEGANAQAAHEETGSAGTVYYKFLTAKNTGTYQDQFVYPLPTRDPQTGEWVPTEWLPAVEGEVRLCKNGYHVTDREHLLQWANSVLVTVEVGGDVVASPPDDGDWKLAARSIRLLSVVESWNERTLRHYACDCAERVLPLMVVDNEKGAIAKNCIDTARRYADGQATEDEMLAARYAAWGAAWNAASDPAWNAARDAARDAASDAARDAARDAAWIAARDAAWNAAWGAAWGAARDAEQAWQTERLWRYLSGEIVLPDIARREP